MKTFSSAAQFYLEMHGQQVTRTLVGGHAYEDWDEQCAYAIDGLLSQGAALSDIDVTDDELSIGNQFMLRSKMRREVTGELTVRSKDTIFDGCYGNKKGTRLLLDKSGIERDVSNGAVVQFRPAPSEQLSSAAASSGGSLQRRQCKG
jgi:hypothetical protein